MKTFNTYLIENAVNEQDLELINEGLQETRPERNNDHRPNRRPRQKQRTVNLTATIP